MTRTFPLVTALIMTIAATASTFAADYNTEVERRGYDRLAAAQHVSWMNASSEREMFFYDQPTHEQNVATSDELYRAETETRGYDRWTHEQNVNR